MLNESGRYRITTHGTNNPKPFYQIRYHKISHYSVLSSEIIISNQKLLCLFLTDGGTSAPGSFMYSLRNKDNLGPFKAPLRDQNDVHAIRSDNLKGPIFGSGHDLHIANNAGSNDNSLANFGHSYKLPSGYTEKETETKSLLAASFKFMPSEIEVLYLN